MKTYVTVYFGAALVVMLFVPIVSRLAKKYHLVDAPGPRKVHQTPIPRIGGIVFVIATLAMVLPVFFLDNEIGQSFRQTQTKLIALLVAACFIFFVGLIDDLHPLRGYIKLLCLIAASLVICASGATLRSISIGKWFELETAWAAWPLAVFWITMITVCINLIDGLDGLAAGIAAIVCGTIVLFAIWSDQKAMAVLMLALLGSVTGFLFFNFHPAKIFMGDSGSMFLGFLIGAGSLICQTKTSALVGLALPFLVLGVPILDMGYAVVRRSIFERRSIFAPDKSHLHHRLLDLGLRQGTVVIAIYAVTIISASIGVFMLTVEGGWSIGLLVLGLLLLFSMFAFIYRGHYQKIREALKRNWTIAHGARTEKRNYENAQVRICESTSLREWWETICAMGKQMHFQSIELWRHDNDNYVSIHTWNSPEQKSATVKTLKLFLPLNGKGATEWEIRASIVVSGYLELSGRQAMLLTRLMDEFPPPEQQIKAETSNQPSHTTHGFMVEEKNGCLVNTQVLNKPACMPSPLNIMGIPVVPFESYEQAVQCIEELIESGQKSSCFAINPIKIYKAWRESELFNLLRQSNVGICDGIGVSIASWILHGRSIKRCTGCDLFFKLLSLASRKNWGVYFLGASAQSNIIACTRLQKTYPKLRIVGCQDGYFKDSHTVIEKINASRADLLFVAMGSPKQEYWILRNWQAIDAKFCMGVGGSFDIASGSIGRAPKILRTTGTEFLFRLAKEPRKRWKIQKVLFPYFFRVIGKKMVDVTLTDEDSQDGPKQ